MAVIWHKINAHMLQCASAALQQVMCRGKQKDGPVVVATQPVEPTQPCSMSPTTALTSCQDHSCEHAPAHLASRALAWTKEATVCRPLKCIPLAIGAHLNLHIHTSTNISDSNDNRVQLPAIEGPAKIFCTFPPPAVRSPDSPGLRIGSDKKTHEASQCMMAHAHVDSEKHPVKRFLYTLEDLWCVADAPPRPKNPSLCDESSSHACLACHLSTSAPERGRVTWCRCPCAQGSPGSGTARPCTCSAVHPCPAPEQPWDRGGTAR